MDLLKPSYASGYAKNASQSAHPNLWDGLVGAWMPSLGVTGDTLRDVSGNGNHGTLNGMDAASDWVATSKGLALDFDGVDDYVDIGRLEGFGSSQRGTTIVTLASRKTFNGNDFIFDGSTSASFGYGVSLRYKNDNKVRFWNYNANFSVDTNFTVTDSQFHQIAATFDGGNSVVYIDAKKDAEKSGDSATSANGNFRIGSSQVLGNPASFSGVYFYAYNRALSPQEIKHLYVDSLAPFRRKQRVSVAVPAGIQFKPYWAKQSTQISGLLK